MPSQFLTQRAQREDTKNTDGVDFKFQCTVIAVVASRESAVDGPPVGATASSRRLRALTSLLSPGILNSGTVSTSLRPLTRIPCS